MSFYQLSSKVRIKIEQLRRRFLWGMEAVLLEKKLLWFHEKLYVKVKIKEV
jgi:hypothetical protein